MPNARRGEVWPVDLGLVAKVRPALVVSVPFLDCDRAVYLIMPHTTALRGTRFEAAIDLPLLEKGAFDAQGIRNVPGSVFLQRLGSLNSEQLKIAEAAIRRIFGLE